jgi:hypothetical protein
MITNLNWTNPQDQLPKIKNAIGAYRNKDSEVVLVFVGENGYSDRECTLAYYSHSNKCWEFLEDKYSGFSILLWSYLPVTLDFESLKD